MDEILIVPLHKYPQYLLETCKLINTEWSRSESARLHSLEQSSDTLPVSLILLKKNSVIGHIKISRIPTILKAGFVEIVVIDKLYRGQGYGTLLMREAEQYCLNTLHLQSLYLATKGQEDFYKRLKYIECGPITLYGSATKKSPSKDNVIANTNYSDETGPRPPPLINLFPLKNNNNCDKTYMRKDLIKH